MITGGHLSEETKRKISLWQKGRKKSTITRQKMALTKLGKNNPMWKGDNAKLPAIHKWMERNKPKPKFCEACKINPPHDLANISQKYYRDVNDFEWLCRKCHMTKDGRILRVTVGKRDKRGYFI